MCHTLKLQKSVYRVIHSQQWSQKFDLEWVDSCCYLQTRKNSGSWSEVWILFQNGVFHCQTWIMCHAPKHHGEKQFLIARFNYKEGIEKNGVANRPHPISPNIRFCDVFHGGCGRGARVHLCATWIELLRHVIGKESDCFEGDGVLRRWATAVGDLDAEFGKGWW